MKIARLILRGEGTDDHQGPLFKCSQTHESVHEERLDINDYLFQQDGASSHTAHNVIAWLQKQFRDHALGV